MKINMSCLFTKLSKSICLYLLLMGINASSNADVIIDDAVLQPNVFDPSPSNYVLTLSQSTGGIGLFAINISGVGEGMYDFSYFGIAEEYGLYSTALGLEFIPSYALTHTPIVSNNGVDPGSSLQSFSLNQTKYYAYWDDRLGPDSDPDSNDNFGWVGMTYTDGGLLVSDGATALGGGIIVGTYTQVPEPATALLLVIGGVGAWLLRRDRRLRAEQ